MINNQHSFINLNLNSIEIMSRVLASQLLMLSANWLRSQTKSFIKIQNKNLDQNMKDIERFAYPTFVDRPPILGNTLKEQDINEFCLCEPTQSLSYSEETPNFQSYSTYKQLKQVAKETNPEITKEEIYDELLKPFRHEKVKEWSEEQNRFNIYYICRYEDCNREFTKTWNLLDHVRMHEGIKPFACQLWGKTFTQKGNLRKHNIVQHSAETLENRKKFRCYIWEKGYTERYNLVVNLFYIFIYC